MQYKIVYDPDIVEQLKEIKKFISLKSSTMGSVVVERLRKKMRTLKLEPTRGIPLKNKVSFTITRDVRFVIESGYYIFYFVEIDFVYIYLITHSSEDYGRFFDFLK